MRFVRRTVILTAVLVATAPAVARLKPITWEQFRQKAPCGILGRIVSLENLETGAFSLNIAASIGWVSRFGGCPSDLPNPLPMRFQTEIHSSRPQEGDWAVVFPRSYEAIWVEAVYGRSYWKVIPDPSSPPDRLKIQLDWRNRFLTEVVQPRGPRSGRNGQWIRFEDVLDLW